MWNLLQGFSQMVHRLRQPSLDGKLDCHLGQFGSNCGQVRSSLKNFAILLS